MDRLEWNVMEWKKEEGDVVIVDDSTDSSCRDQEDELVMGESSVLAPLGSTLSSFSHRFYDSSFNTYPSISLPFQESSFVFSSSLDRSDLTLSNLVQEESSIDMLPVNPPQDSMEMTDDSHQPVIRSAENPATIRLYNPEQVCGLYLSGWDRSSETGLADANQVLSWAGVGTDRSGNVGGGDHFDPGSIGESVQPRSVQSMHLDSPLDGGAIGVPTRRRQSVFGNVRDPDRHVLSTPFVPSIPTTLFFSTPSSPL